MDGAARRVELVECIDLLKRLLSTSPERVQPGLERAVQVLERRLKQLGAGKPREAVSPNFDEVPTGLERGSSQLNAEAEVDAVAAEAPGARPRVEVHPRAGVTPTPRAVTIPAAPLRAAPAAPRIPSRLSFDDQDLRCPHCGVVVLKRERINLGADRGGAPEFCGRCGGRTGEEPPPLGGRGLS